MGPGAFGPGHDRAGGDRGVRPPGPDAARRHTAGTDVVSTVCEPGRDQGAGPPGDPRGWRDGRARTAPGPTRARPAPRSSRPRALPGRPDRPDLAGHRPGTGPALAERRRGGPSASPRRRPRRGGRDHRARLSAAHPGRVRGRRPVRRSGGRRPDRGGGAVAWTGLRGVRGPARDRGDRLGAGDIEAHGHDPADRDRHRHRSGRHRAPGPRTPRGRASLPRTALRPPDEGALPGGPADRRAGGLPRLPDAAR